MAPPPVVAVEIGTSKVVALVGEMREDNHVMITGMGEHASAGVRKGEIIDFENAALCLRSALAMAEESGRVAIRQAHVALSGGHIQSAVNRGTVPVLSRDGVIGHDDIEAVMDVAKAVNLPADREILHTICQHFCVDDQERVIKPEGMEGSRLSLDMLVLHGIRARLKNAVRVVRSIPLDVEDVVFSGLCSALSVLTPEQKQSGVVTIDLGGGTTDYVVYAGNVLAAAGSLGVGGDHLTNDIVLAFNIPTARAERLKKDFAGVAPEHARGDRTITIPAEVGFQGRGVKQKALHLVVHARMEEMLETIRKRLAAEGVLRQLAAGVVLTGGGSHLRGVEKLTERVFGLPCSIGSPRNISGLATATEGPEYATCSGLVQYGFRTVRETGRGRGLREMLKELLGVQT